MKTEGLNAFFEKRNYNHAWLQHYLNEGTPTPDKFPYELADEGIGTISSRSVKVLKQESAFSPEQHDRPAFVLTIPYVPQKSYEDLIARIALLKTASYGENSNDRPALVFGLNRAKSIDERRNRAFISYAENLPEISGIAFRALAFFWEPVWNVRSVYRDPHLLAKEDAYFLLKVVRPLKAEEALKTLETNKISSWIPYQRIREMIKNSQHTSDFVDLFYSKGRRSVYVATMDPDFTSISDQRGKGVLSYCQDTIMGLGDRFPHVITTGYSAARDQWPMTRLGIILDMKVRTVLASFFPTAAYYPEPFFAFHVSPQKNALRRASFVTNGGRLESRRLIDSGINAGVFDKDRMVFTYSDVLTTDTERMVTQKSREFSKIDAKNIGTKNVLSGIRAVGQSHVFPKQFAENIYHALPITCRVTDITTPIMRIYGVFDPINLSYSYQDGGRYSAKNFKHIVDSYDAYTDRVLQAIESPWRREVLAQEYAQTIFPNGGTDQILAKRSFVGRVEIVLAAHMALQEKGLDAVWRNRIVEVTYRSGQAMKSVFADILAGRLSFVKV